MAYDIFGDYYESYQDIYERVLPTINNLEKYKLCYKNGTKQGFSLSRVVEDYSITNCNGFYFIYYYDKLVYIGECSGKNTIHTRISRFIKTILGNNSPDENHPAAEKHLWFLVTLLMDLKSLCWK
jgi:hypothetical protein